ncbi:hypothetical protein GLOIN_2v1595045 [Rhizophagus clarus]|uniref:Uncharacterized protein n=1 Tax=Rhizophagus clarus TaxID=94130 RepID=A0A8H3QH69_9GLOM|nr:hypothetical protein GLOIN_2v1595045 [Rhizophagus clarus]
MQARAHEECSTKGCYENSRQLNVVAKAIFIHPDLILTWKEISYYVNELVIPGALLIFFPPLLTDREWLGVHSIVTPYFECPAELGTFFDLYDVRLKLNVNEVNSIKSTKIRSLSVIEIYI